MNKNALIYQCHVSLPCTRARNTHNKKKTDNELSKCLSVCNGQTCDGQSERQKSEKPGSRSQLVCVMTRHLNYFNLTKARSLFWDH